MLIGHFGHRWWRAAGLLLALTLVLAACNSEGDGDGGDASAPSDDGAAADDGGDATNDDGDAADDGGDDGSGEWEPEWVDGVLQPLPDGFPEKTITLIVADDLTTRDGVLAQDLANFGTPLSPVPLAVEARPEYDAGWGTWEALKFASDDADGQEGYFLTLAGTPADLADLLTTDLTEDIGLDETNKGEVITLEDNPYLFLQCPDAPWGEASFEAFIEYAKENPGEVRYMGGGPGAGSDVAAAYYLRGMGVGNLYDPEVIDHRNVGNTSDRATAVAACEGDVTNVSFEASQPHIEAGRVEVILHSGEGRLEQFPDVPSAQEAGVPGNQWSTMRQIVVPSSVDPLHIQWLYELLNAIVSQDDYVAKRSQAPGTLFLNWDPEESAAFTADFMPVLDELMRELGIHKEQVEN